MARRFSSRFSAQPPQTEVPSGLHFLKALAHGALAIGYAVTSTGESEEGTQAAPKAARKGSCCTARRKGR